MLHPGTSGAAECCVPRMCPSPLGHSISFLGGRGPLGWLPWRGLSCPTAELERHLPWPKQVLSGDCPGDGDTRVFKGTVCPWPPISVPWPALSLWKVQDGCLVGDSRRGRPGERELSDMALEPRAGVGEKVGVLRGARAAPWGPGPLSSAPQCVMLMPCTSGRLGLLKS